LVSVKIATKTMIAFPRTVRTHSAVNRYGPWDKGVRRMMIAKLVVVTFGPSILWMEGRARKSCAQMNRVTKVPIAVVDYARSAAVLVSPKFASVLRNESAEMIIV
jgi:hypothetical protein